MGLLFTPGKGIPFLHRPGFDRGLDVRTDSCRRASVILSFGDGTRLLLGRLPRQALFGLCNPPQNSVSDRQ